MTIFDQCMVSVWERELSAIHRLLSITSPSLDNDEYLDSLEELESAAKESRRVLTNIRRQGS